MPRSKRSTPSPKPLTEAQRAALRTAIQEKRSIRAEASRLGVTHGKAQRFAAKVRTADEFPKRSTQNSITAPRREMSITDWTLEAIRSARNAQMRGDFKQAVRLAEAMRTDTAIYVARNNRVCAHAAVDADFRARDDTTRAIAVAGKAALSIITPRSVVSGIQATLVDHAVAIGRIERETSPDGLCVSMRLTEWPLEHVKENTSTEILETTVLGGGARVPIMHGDGEWIIFRRKGIRPWAQDATLLPAAFVFAIHTPAMQDWAATARSHGLAKVLGKLGVQQALEDEKGNLTAEAQHLLTTINDIVSGYAAAGLLPDGASAEFISNPSTAWQVFTELAGSVKKDAARIYNGSDAVLGSTGGAPGVDISELFRVTTTILQGDFQAIEDGINSGMVDPWTAINYGDSRLAPRWKYLIPDPDLEKRVEQIAARTDRFLATCKAWREIGFVLDQETVNRLGKAYGLDVIPELPPAPPTPPALPAPATAPALPPAPTDPAPLPAPTA